MVVMGEVIVIVVVAVPVLAMPIVAMPIIIAMPCRAAMPATTAPSTNTGDVSATYSASIDVAAADVADVSSANMDAAHVADVASAYMDAAHAAATHPTPEMASSAVAGIRLTDQARDKYRLPARAATAVICFFMTTSPWVRKSVIPPADFVESLTLEKGGSLRWIPACDQNMVCNPVGSNSTSLFHVGCCTPD